ncbi:rhythmically expressed gene 2 protein-like [Amphibalanus amphitrite]|uniref:rhythmically expressed gene 2 protein-like n=1 Tax=Amphibalanus amphitrite TaxID=1232801 RepID=UPI001C92902C|nr:rhythmically expressed gene 2 protein-like [Amphibalanus amphitrite]
MSRLVTFDATNTLIRLRYSPGDYYAAVAGRHGLVVSAPEADRSFRHHFRTLLAEEPNFGRGLAGGWRRWWTTLVGRVLTDASAAPPSSETAGAVADRLLADYAGVECWRTAEGAVPLLERLAARDIRLGVVSNFDPRLHRLLERFELSQYFDFVIASYEHPFCKPDQRIFELARRSAGADRCTHVGDSVRLDYEAARAAGWEAVLVGSVPPEAGVDPAHLCPRLADLEKYLKF